MQQTSEGDTVQKIHTDFTGKSSGDSRAPMGKLFASVLGMIRAKGIDCALNSDHVKVLINVSSNSVGEVQVSLNGELHVLRIQPRMYEPNGKGDHNSVILRDAANRGELLARTRRVEGHVVSEFASLYLAGRTPVLDGYVLFCTLVANDFDPLEVGLQSTLASDWKNGLVTERFRWFSKSLWQTVEFLHQFGFFFLFFLPGFLGVDRLNNRIKLLQGGYGMLRSRTTGKEEGGLQLLRRTTTHYALNGSSKRTESVNNRRCKEVAARMEQERQGQLFDELAARAGTGEMELSESDTRNFLAKFQGKLKGTIEPRGAGHFLYKSLHPIHAATSEKPDFEKLKTSDAHQVAMWMVSVLWPGVEKQRLRDALKGDQVNDDMITRMCRLLDTNGQGNQPAAIRRLAGMVTHALHGASKFTSDDLFLTLPVWPREREAEILGEGVLIHGKVRARGEAAWNAKADKCLKDSKLLGGIKRLGLDQNPQAYRLVNEEDKGVGAKVVGRLEENAFVGWYVGRSKAKTSGRFVGNRPPLSRCFCDAENPYGRYVVANKSMGFLYCDSEPCSELSLEMLIEYGAPGPFINAAKKPNVRLLRSHGFEFEGEIWYPMQAIHTVVDGFLSWKYDFEAERGRNRRM